MKMQFIEDQGSESFENAIKKHISPSLELFTDGFKSYSKLKNNVKKHVAQKVSPK